MITTRTNKIALILFVLIIGIFLYGGGLVLAQENNVINEGLQAFGNETILGQEDPRVIIARVIRILLGFLGTVALAIVMYGGFLYMTSGGSEERVGKAKKWLINGIIGMVIIMSAFALTSFIIGALSDATGITNGSGTNTGTGTGPIGGESGYTVGISPVGENKPVNVVIKIQFPYGHLPASVENAQQSIKVYQLSGEEKTEVEVPGTFGISGRTVTFTPSGACPAGCEAENCFAINTEYRVKINDLQDSNNERIICPNPMLGYCKMVEFSTSGVCDLSGPDIAISQIAPQPLKQNNLFSTFVGARDNGGIFALELCPGWQADGPNVCREYLPENNPTALDYAFYNLDSSEAGFNLSLGWHDVKLFGEDVVGYKSEVTKRMLVASEACFDDNDEFNCSLAGCEVPCDECQDEENCEYYCVENETGETVCSPWPYPIIDLILPHYGPRNSFITIQGRNFGAFGPESNVKMDNVVAGLACGGGANSWNNNQVIVKVPEGASDGWIRLTDADGYYNDTSDPNSPGWKDNFLIQQELSSWIGLCALDPTEGMPGTLVDASGENFGESGSVYFNQYTGTSPDSWSSTNISNIRVPNLAAGYVNVQISHNGVTDNVFSNPVRFKILPVEDNLEIFSVTPGDGPQKQLITIKGRNFGTSGTVSFISGADSYLAQFPCDGSWRDTEIIAQVPEDAPDGIYTLQVTGIKGTDSVDFNINNDPLVPGICSMTPNNGQPGTKVNFIGAAFGDDYGMVRFTGQSGVAQNIESGALKVQKVDWQDTKIVGVQVPPTAVSGDVKVIVDGEESNPAYFKVGKCSSDSQCGAGEICCEKSYCSTVDQCKPRITSSAYGWYFSTGLMPQIPKVLERECVLGEYDESTSPSNNEQMACPNGLISFTFNMKMQTAEFLDLENQVEIKHCTDSGRQCNLVECTSEGGCLAENYTFESIGNDLEGNPIINEIQDSVYNNREVTQVVLSDYDLTPDTWYQVVVPAGFRAKDDRGRDVYMPDEYVWTFHTGTEDCDIEDVLVNPAEGVIAEVYETQTYKVSGQAANCAILDVSGYSWNWTLNKYTDHLEKVNDENVKAEFGLKSASQTGAFETLIDDPALVNASTVISGATKSDEAKLAVKFNNPRVVSYWPNCDEACRNAEIGAQFNTYMKKTEIENLAVSNNLAQVFKCDDQDCLSVVGKQNVLSNDSQVECVSTTGLISLGQGANAIDVCNQLRIFPDPVLDPSSFYRVVLNENIKSVSNKTLTGLNFVSTAQTIGFCGNGLIEGEEQCEAICRDKNSGSLCIYDENSPNCVCNLANNPYCDNECQFKAFPVCSATQTINCCGNGVEETYTGNYNVSLTEQCEADCRRIVEEKFVGENANATCTTAFNDLTLEQRASTGCSCSIPQTCEAGEKVCASYCSNDVNRKCTQDSVDCTCIEPKICQEAFNANGQIKYCTGNEPGACTCVPEKACLLLDGGVGNSCSASTENCDCRESGYYQFAPTEKCFVDAVNDPNTPEDETQTKGTCVKKSFCTENPTEQCTADRSACTCVPLTSIAAASCPAADLVCEQVCTFQKVETCLSGEPGCICSMPNGCTNCVVNSTSADEEETIFDAFSWIFKVRDGEAYCRPEKVEVMPANYIATISGQRVIYSGVPYTKPDVCSVNGQRLNIYDYEWDWDSNPEDRSVKIEFGTSLNLFNSAHQKLVALFKQTFAVSSQPGCGDNCLNLGSLVYGSVCGNGIVEKGEECDSNLYCDGNCLHAGTPACFGTSVSDAGAICCGNGVVNSGEDCDGGAGCSDRCLKLGSNASGYTCGNGIKEPGEDEDYGNSTLNTKYGLNANCLLVGSDYPKQIVNGNLQEIESAVCGNGKLEAGEECEPQLLNCQKPNGTSCNPYSDENCVCEKYEDQYCSNKCLLKPFVACGTIKVCQEDQTKQCTNTINKCTCETEFGSSQGVCEEDGVTKCTGDIPPCTCITKEINQNCCGNGILEQVASYDVNGKQIAIKEECEVQCENPVGYFAFNEGSGTTTKNSVTGQLFSIANRVWAEGQSGTALQYNNNGWINLKNTFDWQTTDGAISLWFKTSDQITRTLISKIIDSSSYYQPGMYTINLVNGQVQLRFIDANEAVVTNFGIKNYNDNKWHHLALIFDRDSHLSLYVDGNLELRNTTQALNMKDLDLRNNGVVLLGARGLLNEQGGSMFVGSIDELKFFRSALTIEDINRLISGAPCANKLPVSCTPGCLNAGVNPNFSGESYCGNGVVEPGEDALCEANRGSQMGAPYMNLQVLGYLQGSVLSETLNVVGKIKSNVSFAERDAGVTGGTMISGNGKFTYVYTGNGPVPAGCDLNNPPKGILTSPTQFNACPNGAIVIDYDQTLEFFAEPAILNNLTSYVKLEYLESSDKCNSVAINSNSLFSKLAQKVKDIFHSLTGNDVVAQQSSPTPVDLVWCSETNYSVSISSGQGEGDYNGSRITILTNGELLKTKNYRVRLLQMKNNCDMNMGDQQFTFNVKADVCQLDGIKVLQEDEENSEKVWVPDKIATERNEDWETIHYPLSGLTILQPVKGYNWEWKAGINASTTTEWSTADASLISFDLGAATTDPDQVEINNKIGRTTITAYATITEDYFYGKVGTVIQGSGTVDVFLCENPWSISPSALGWTENQYNIRLMYCRDAGNINATDDDLPDLRVVEGPSASGSLLKEYFFLRSDLDAQTDGSGDAIALRVYANPNHLSSGEWFMQNVPNIENSTLSPMKVACDIHPYYGTEVCYYGVRDGNTIYIVAGNLNNNVLYDNIYILAYNLEANSTTTGIYSQMLNYLTFNINVGNSNERWKIQRDMKRVVDISMLKRFLASYFQDKGSLPEISSGSYLRGMSLSSWLSWNSVLQVDLREYLQSDASYRGQIPEDPINYFEQYDPSTNYSGTRCAEDSRSCLTGNHQCFAAKNSSVCSVCAPGSDPLTCYDSTTLQVTIPPADIFSSNSYLYGYQYMTYNSALLYYNLEGNYSVNNQPESSLYID